MRALRLVVVAGAVCALVFAPIAASATPQADQVQNVTPNIGGGNAVCGHGGGSDENVEPGSTFTAGITGRLTGIDLPVDTAGPTADMVVEVFATQGGVPVGSAVAAESIPLASLTPLSAGGTLRITFTHPAQVEAGSTYGFAFGFPTCVDRTRLGFLTVAPDSSTKTYFEKDARGWLGYGILGMNFTTYVDAAPPGTDDPSAATLAQTGSRDATVAGALALAGVLLGTGALLARRRIRPSRSQ